MKKILLIGCGHMGNALLRSWVISNEYSITVIDPLKYTSLKKQYKNKNIEFLKKISNLKDNLKFDFIVFATKPKELNRVLNDLSPFKFKIHTLMISIIAGKKISIFKNKFKYLNNFFRVMPNMPASIGESMNCIVANPKVNKNKISQVIKLFSYSGKTQLLKNEDQIDMATAISGSGPGFVFNIVDAMEKAAINLGFDRRISKLMVFQTFKGSIELLQHNRLDAKELVNTVATKGGTTEAGLKVMHKNNFHKIFKNLTKASYKKAKDQGK